MNVPTTIDAGAWLSKYLDGADGDTDMVRSMLGAFADAVMSPGVDAGDSDSFRPPIPIDSGHLFR